MELIENNPEVQNRVMLVALILPSTSQEEVDKSLDELERLVDTAGGETVIRVTQARPNPDVATAVGKGKVEEIAEACNNHDINLVVYDGELSPSQIRNLEDGIGGDVSVIDRSMLILDIFALHAVTGEGKLQVELAQLKYTAPRLMGKGKSMSRLGGGIGTRGPGETKLESDRRHLKRRIVALEEELSELDRTRQTMRAARDRSGIPEIAIVGYTNAGKSTLLNYLTDAGILAQDKLFATLDPTTRKFTLPSGTPVLLTDTVGFIRKLPHHLVKAFKSTLDTAVYADILLILLDFSDDEYPAQLQVTYQIINELKAGDKPMLLALNKRDKAKDKLPILPDFELQNIFAISSVTGEGVDALVNRIEEIVNEGKRRLVFTIPNAEQGALNTLYKNAVVEDVEYGPEAVKVTAVVDNKVRGMLAKYLPEADRPHVESEKDW